MKLSDHTYFRIMEVADHFRVSRRTIERRIAEGELVKVKVGHSTLITAESLSRYIERNTERAG